MYNNYKERQQQLKRVGGEGGEGEGWVVSPAVLHCYVSVRASVFTL
jgi:hypothetical protein